MNKKIIAIGVAAAAVIGGGVYWQKNKAAPTSYREVKVKKGDLAVSIQTTGTVSPENRLEIKPPVAGRVDQVLVVEGQNVRKGQVLAWMSSTERAAVLDAAHANGPDEVKKWEELYKPTPVIAPISGTIILRNVESGQTFSGTDSILTMSDRLTVKAQVDETDVASVKLAQKAEIILDAYPGQKISAKVDKIAFDAKTVNNVTTYVVDVLPENTPAFMRSGMTANVSFFVEAKQDVILVPNDSFIYKDDGAYVLVSDPNSKKPIERKVKSGLSDGRKTEILDGVVEDETLLIAQINPKDSKSKPGFSNPLTGNRPRMPGRPGGH